MFEQLPGVCRRYEELSARMNQPETAADPALLRRLMKEYSELTPLVEAWQGYTAAQQRVAEAQELLQSEDARDPEFRAMIQQELCENRQAVAQGEALLKLLLLPKDENDGKDVIVEIRGGAGGEEAALFAHSLFRMYSMYAQKKGWQLELLSASETELGGVKEVVFSLNGSACY
ncbi:MAG: PCRF domain-containing protein, partial [Faecalibacterium sp.]|nr:PCRF domain-containing protein [Faecalibacterium sp.]